MRSRTGGSNRLESWSGIDEVLAVHRTGNWTASPGVSRVMSESDVCPWLALGQSRVSPVERSASLADPARRVPGLPPTLPVQLAGAGVPM